MTVDKMIKFLEEFDNPEQKFIDYAKEINGLVGPGSVALLNGCVKLMDVNPEAPDYCYLEVGTFQGMSLIGAEMGNHIDCYGVENFAEEFRDNWEKHDPTKQSNRLILEHHLEQFESNAQMHYQDYREFFQDRETIAGAQAQVYLYDGPHTFAHQLAGLILAMPVLADHAIVFVDDYKCPDVPKAIARALSMPNDYVREIKHWVEPYNDFREGFVALEFKR